jgi:putative ABC transport system permease protein
MNALRVVLRYLLQRPLSSALNVLLLAIGVATIALLVLVTTQLQERLTREAAGIDLVVGAKGSPLQLILSSIFHVDVPTGNVPLAEVRALQSSPLVAKVIPLSLGDSFRGFRIVGTEAGYVEHYGGRPASGRLWAKPMEATLGAAVAAATGLSVGAQFAGSHGLGDGGGEHGEQRYRVVGVLAPSGTVLDRLVLTSLESVWDVHDQHGGDAEPAGAVEEPALEVTAALVAYRSPLAAASLPRAINARSRLQAASPPYEIARLLAVFGVGVDALQALAWVLIASAALGVFVALYQALSERRYDIAIMRTLGASRGRIVGMMILESLMLVVPGTLLGLLLGHALVYALGWGFPEAHGLGLSGLRWAPGEGWVVVIAFASGILAALLPALRAYRLDVAATLARG